MECGCWPYIENRNALVQASWYSHAHWYLNSLDLGPPDLEVAKIWQAITVVINQLHVLIFQNSISLLILLKNMKVTKKPFIIVCIISKFKWHVDEIEMLKALAHYNWNCKKEVACTQTKTFFLRTATVFATVSYMGNDFSPKLQCLMIHFTVAMTILYIYLDS